MPYLTVWTDAITTLESLFAGGLAILDAVSDAVATNIFFQLLFGMVVFGLGYLVISKVTTLIKKIAGAGGK